MILFNKKIQIVYHTCTNIFLLADEWWLHSLVQSRGGYEREQRCVVRPERRQVSDTVEPLFYGQRVSQEFFP